MGTPGPYCVSPESQLERRRFAPQVGSARADRLFLSVFVAGGAARERWPCRGRVQGVSCTACLHAALGGSELLCVPPGGMIVGVFDPAVPWFVSVSDADLQMAAKS